MRRASARSAKIELIDMAVETLNLTVRGMTCANCARTVQNTLSSVPGVTHSTVDLNAASATVEYDTDLIKPEAIVTAVCDLGYEARA